MQKAIPDVIDPNLVETQMPQIYLGGKCHGWKDIAKKELNPYFEVVENLSAEERLYIDTSLYIITAIGESKRSIQLNAIKTMQEALRLADQGHRIHIGISQLTEESTFDPKVFKAQHTICRNIALKGGGQFLNTYKDWTYNLSNLIKKVIKIEK